MAPSNPPACILPTHEISTKNPNKYKFKCNFNYKYKYKYIYKLSVAASNPPHSCIVILIQMRVGRSRTVGSNSNHVKHRYPTPQVAAHCRLNSTACATLGRWLIQSRRVRKRAGRIKTMSQSHHCHTHHSWCALCIIVACFCCALCIIVACLCWCALHCLLNYPRTKTAPPQVLKPPLHTLPHHQHQHQRLHQNHVQHQP